jgi:hypothetical protein
MFLSFQVFEQELRFGLYQPGCSFSSYCNSDAASESEDWMAGHVHHDCGVLLSRQSPHPKVSQISFSQSHFIALVWRTIKLINSASKKISSHFPGSVLLPKNYDLIHTFP